MKKGFSAGIILFFVLLSSLYCQSNTNQMEQSDLADQLFPEEDPEIIKLREVFLSFSREDFLLKTYQNLAFRDIPLPAGNGLIDPAPSFIAAILKEARIRPLSKVLIIGRNTDYLNALISRLTNSLYVSDPGLNSQKKTDYQFKNDLSYYSWVEESPFNCIILFGAVSEIPQSLTTQLSANGRIIAPIESKTGNQILVSTVKYSDSFALKILGGSYIHNLEE